MVHAVNELLALNQFMVSELTARDFWNDGFFAGLNIFPVLCKFLSIRYDTVDRDPVLARQEACRICAILYLAGIRCRFGGNLTTNIYIPKLKESIIAQNDPNLGETDPILLWLLMIGGIQSFMHEEHKWFVSAIANRVVHNQYSSWRELMAVACRVLWIDGLLKAECSELRDELSTELWTSHRHEFS